MDFFDRTRHEFVDFATIEEMETFFTSSYTPIDNCYLGDLGAIQFFLATSNTYNFDMSYRAIDVTGDFSLVQETGFDAQRNSNRQVYKDRQSEFIKKTTSEYLNFFNEIKKIYTTGIYSPCYAEPGWSENTWYLKSLREGIMPRNNSARFPYNNVKINKTPPR